MSPPLVEAKPVESAKPEATANSRSNQISKQQVVTVELFELGDLVGPVEPVELVNMEVKDQFPCPTCIQKRNVNTVFNYNH